MVGGPYHRNGQAILDTIHATHEPARGHGRSSTRATSTMWPSARSRVESAIAINKAPDGLVADLIAGKVPAWLQPVGTPEKTALRLWRVVR